MPRGVAPSRRATSASSSLLIDKHLEEKSKEFQQKQKQSIKDNELFFEDKEGSADIRQKYREEDNDSDGPSHRVGFSTHTSKKEWHKIQKRQLKESESVNGIKMKSSAKMRRKKSEKNKEMRQNIVNEQEGNFSPLMGPQGNPNKNNPNDPMDIWGDDDHMDANHKSNKHNSINHFSTSSAPSSSHLNTRRPSRSNVFSLPSSSLFSPHNSLSLSAPSRRPAPSSSSSLPSSSSQSSYSSSVPLSSSSLSHLLAPPSGSSYNPNEKARLALVNMAAKIANKEERERHLLSNESKAARRRDERNTKEGVMEEKENEDDKDNIMKDIDLQVSLTKPKVLKGEKQLQKHLKSLDKIVVEVKNQEKRDNNKRKRRENEESEEKERRDNHTNIHVPKYGKYKFTAPFPSVPLLSDLPSNRSLLSVTPTVSLLTDQMKRFEARRLIEVRKRVKGMKRRYKEKMYSRDKDEKDDVAKMMEDRRLVEEAEKDKEEEEKANGKGKGKKRKTKK